MAMDHVHDEIIVLSVVVDLLARYVAVAFCSILDAGATLLLRMWAVGDYSLGWGGGNRRPSFSVLNRPPPDRQLCSSAAASS